MKKILVAEDDPFLIKVYETKLAKVGYEVQLAKDGIEVFEKLENFIPEIILLDLIMPRKDGFTVLAELKQNEKYKNIPVIVTSNLGQIEDKQKAEHLGATEYIIKSDTPIAVIIDKISKYTS